MSLLLAPYTHAMRLGQGFNSYTQQICIDHAVVVDEQTPENVVTNDGTTMRIMVQKNGNPSAWTRQKEVVVSQPATAVLVENAKRAMEEVAIIEKELAAAEEDAEEDDPKALLEAAGKEEPSPEQEPENQEAAEPEGEPAPEEEVPTKEEEVPTKEEEAPAKEEDASAKESDSVDEIADAEEARKEVDAPVAEEGEVEVPQKEAAKPVTKKASRGRASSTTPDTKASGKKSAQQPSQAKGDDGDVDMDAAMADIEANASKDNKIDRAAIGANLRANSGKTASKTPMRRSASSDRARQSLATAPSGPPDRAAIRAALTGKAVENPTLLAEEKAELLKIQEEEAELLKEQRAYQKKLLVQQRQDEADRRKEEREEQRAIRQEQRVWDAKRREESRKAIQEAASLKATTLEDLEKIRAQNQFVERFNGINEQTQKHDFDPTAPRGPSQTVTYTSRFVDRLSDVLDDMSVSGSLSIKAGKVGGSGKGSFVDSDKFKESDLNFYISVKVVNQTINFKDALVFNPCRSVDANNFREVYGDSYISGFIEGGEFNALVSMKILNKAKKTDIQAQAKVALTAGTVDITADANVGIARSNIETNTETTIQVSWSGGGHIKPMEQQWDIQSLMSAAARFPDLVADCPQRTYAILTKYDALRSFVNSKPASFTPLQYENAQIYTNTLLDSFVSYKSLYKRLGEQIFGVQSKTLEIIPWGEMEKRELKQPDSQELAKNKDEASGVQQSQKENFHFDASLQGLSEARTAIRRQMARIVNEVDLIEKRPKIATDEDHAEPYQSPVAFEARIAKVEVPERLRVKGTPLSGQRIAAKPLTDNEKQQQIKDEEALDAAPLYTEVDKRKLLEAEIEKFEKLLAENPSLGQHFRASSAAGDRSRGEPFNNLEYLKSDWSIRSIRTEMANGALVYLAVSYSNGILVEKGASRQQSRVKAFGPFLLGERINSASIEYGTKKKDNKDQDDAPTQVLGLRLFTNRGRALIARALRSEQLEKGAVARDGVTYENVNVLYMDCPFSSGSIKGFFGRSDDGPDGKILRLGIIWCRMPEMTSQETEAQFADTGDTVDSEDLTLLQKDRTNLRETKDELLAAQNRISRLEKALQTKDAQCGSFSAGEKGWRSNTNSDSSARCEVEFSRPYPSKPKLLFGLNLVDFESNKPRICSLSNPEVSHSGFNVKVSTWGGSNSYNIGCSWLALPDDLHLETDMVHTWDGGQSSYKTFTKRITFNQSFEGIPKVHVWFQGISYTELGYMSIFCIPEDVTSTSFTLKIATGDNRTFQNASVQYLAYPSSEDGKRVKSAREGLGNPPGSIDLRGNFYGGPFNKIPGTFIAICKLDFGSDRNTRFKAKATAPNNRELEWHKGTWGDSQMSAGDIAWIAIE